jgi:toxin ParE1/3/4
MRRIARTIEAKEDLLDIWLYINRRSRRNADRFIEKIEEKLELIAGMPGIGQRRDDFGPDLRSFPVGDYLIFYQPLQDGILVVRVLHGAQNLRRIFKQE